VARAVSAVQDNPKFATVRLPHSAEAAGGRPVAVPNSMR